MYDSCTQGTDEIIVSQKLMYSYYTGEPLLVTTTISMIWLFKSSLINLINKWLEFGLVYQLR